jgi:glyoxylase-like metal-dependent hydrolase (beta-lactamase superfamily II)
MHDFLCETCGTMYPRSDTPPDRCIICEDERQWVPKSGQRWVTYPEVKSRHYNAFRKISPGLLGLVTMPTFAIGQRAILVQTPDGNVLWDCISLLDDATYDIIQALGGLKSIAVSHPHFYSTIAHWGEVFECPVLLHEADREWVVNPGPALEFWSGESRAVLPQVTLYNFGGHFPGNSILHWADRRAVLAGDTVLVTHDRRHVAFMWSYPNYAPLPASEVARIESRFAALEFDALHTAFWDRGDIHADAQDAIRRSAFRHIHGPNRAFTAD